MMTRKLWVRESKIFLFQVSFGLAAYSYDSRLSHFFLVAALVGIALLRGDLFAKTQVHKPLALATLPAISAAITGFTLSSGLKTETSYVVVATTLALLTFLLSYRNVKEVEGQWHSKLSFAVALPFGIGPFIGMIHFGTQAMLKQGAETIE